MQTAVKTSSRKSKGKRRERELQEGVKKVLEGFEDDLTCPMYVVHSTCQLYALTDLTRPVSRCCDCIAVLHVAHWACADSLQAIGESSQAIAGRQQRHATAYCGASHIGPAPAMPLYAAGRDLNDASCCHEDHNDSGSFLR